VLGCVLFDVCDVESEPAADDPKRSGNFLQSGRPAKSRFFELECHEAAIGDLTQSAMSGSCPSLHAVVGTAAAL
jgi:hypothetical protein